ncbi:two-component system response regulator CssR [Streptohalobacillus salinus]|uniref:Two-component system response regulator CssR n=1 Tax=Streptohalobacillus salinus TaxID=621096 RepID=A0A2V3W7Q0_9BACI|nr:response regulator transcription factor [Streptohalobacillus salinus]PXW89188.1 two-component system response regulator CssR [Streptohalobacillus salinus]
MHERIYIVEDDPNIRDIVKAYLTKEGYQVTVLGDAEAAWAYQEQEQPEMWILDIMLPGMDGYELCKRIREKSDVPIIIISAKDEEVDKILGLELGGDDYLTKPFSPRELVARVKRLFKRVNLKPEKEAAEVLTMGPLEVKHEDRRVFWHKEEVDVTQKEYDLIYHLIQHQNRAFSREELLTLIWGDDYFGSDRAVDDLVKRLRKKMEGLPVETVWGYGYRLRQEGNQ